MATTVPPPIQTTSTTSARPRLSRRQHAVTLLVSTWLIFGLFVDGWAHNNLTELETFFTPWHALFYSGFAACASWYGWLVVRGQESGHRGLAAVPEGYGLGLLGLAIFAVGGAGDMAWHMVFGVEQDIEALFSPTHLLLLSGMALIVTSPLRAGLTGDDTDADGLRSFLPTLLSLTLASALVAFFFMYFSAFIDISPVAREATWPAAEGPYPGDDALLITGIASGLLTNLFLIAPMLYMLRRLHPPFGAVTVLFAVVATMVNALLAFETAVLIIPAVVGGLAADVLIRRLRPSPERPGPFRLVGALAPLILWTAYYLTHEVTAGLTWSLELWTGMVVYNALAGLLLAQFWLPLPAGRARRE